METPEIKDSGVRQQFETGSQRDTREGKGRFDLLPCDAVKRVAIHFESGAKKYAERNWEKGQPLSRYMDSGLRHAFAYLKGDRDEDHLAAAIWNFMCCAQTEQWLKDGKYPKELDDLPGPKNHSELLGDPEKSPRLPPENPAGTLATLGGLPEYSPFNESMRDCGFQFFVSLNVRDYIARFGGNDKKTVNLYSTGRIAYGACADDKELVGYTSFRPVTPEEAWKHIGKLTRREMLRPME